MGTAAVHYSGASIFILLLVGIVLLGITTTNAAPHPAFRYYPRYYSPVSYDGQNPEYLLQTIAKLRQALINEDDLENAAAKRSSIDHSIQSTQYLENYRDGQQGKRESADMGTQRGHSGRSEHMYRMLGYVGR
ncbi:unnamed protein product [Phaedon cochleariae]|uniref:Uncharacterized protein n=1 Tax=Phaedon cochleariae TaxID=80249 RepID=A0A9P0GUS8_PHACE|nr:unnamed protein product [Phaedon cochleariae]